MSSDERKVEATAVDEAVATDAQLAVGEPGSEVVVSSPDERPLSRLHWSSIFFEAVSHGRQFLIPAVFAFLGATGGNWFWGVLAIVSFGFSFLTTIFKYFTLRYGIRSGELIVSHGLLFRNTRTVPTRRIQNMDLKQNPLHRLFGVAEVRIETASGTEAEATLRVLTASQIEQLRRQIFVGKKSSQVAVETAATINGDEPARESQAHEYDHQILAIPSSWLMKVGLASNRGWLLVGIAIGALFQFDIFNQYDGKTVRETIRRFTPAIFDHFPGVITTVGLVLLFVIALKLLGVAWFLLRFYGYRLTRNGQDLRVVSGLFTSYSATIPRQRVQFISIQRSLLMRWMGLATIRIETAGGSGGEDGGHGMMTRSWFVPVIPVDRVGEILNELRPGLNWDESNVQWQSPSPWTRRRLSRAGIIVSILIAVVGYFVYPPWGALFGIALLPFMWYLAIRTSRSMRYTRTGFGVAYRSGIFHRKLSFTFFERLQTVSLKQSPFDRRWKMATLSVDTAAAGPANHLIDVEYLDEDFARSEFNWLQQAAATHRPVWS